MARSLVIVESPAKAKTINKYLGRDYSVKASYGHVMDLPKKTLGVLLPGDENGRKRRTAKGKAKTSRKAGKRSVADKTFEPKLEIIPGSWTPPWSTPNKRGAFSTAWSATRFRRFFGTRSAGVSPPGACRPWLCG